MKYFQSKVLGQETNLKNDTLRWMKIAYDGSSLHITQKNINLPQIKKQAVPEKLNSKRVGVKIIENG